MFTDYNGPAVDAPRIRELNNWTLDKYTDDQGTYYALTGITISENGVKLDVIRFTKTGPIVSCDKNIVITESGSIYTLLDQASGGGIHLETLEDDCYICKEYWLPTTDVAN